MAGVRVTAQFQQKELATALGLSGEERVSRIENGRAPMTVDLFISWCRACHAAPEDVIKSVPSI